MNPRKLAQRDDLQVSYATIWYSVAVLDQLRLLPEDVGSALPMAHHKLLLPVRDPKAKVRLAKKAVEKQLTSRDFAEEVKRARAKEADGPRAGRPPLPAFVKGLSRLRKVIEFATSEELGEATFATYSPARARVLVGELDGQITALAQLKAKVLAAAALFEAAAGAE
jgi:hypothetical protein